MTTDSLAAAGLASPTAHPASDAPWVTQHSALTALRMPLFVLGHRNPDTDAIVTAIAYADLLRQRGYPEAVAGRLGDVRPETAWVLERFGFKPPDLVEDVHVRVCDVMTTPPMVVNRSDSLHEIGRKVQALAQRSLPVVDDAYRLVGIVESRDFARAFFEGITLESESNVKLELAKVVDALDGQVLHEGPVRELRNEVRVAGMALETALGRFRPGILLVVGDRDDIQRGAIELGVGAIVVTGDLPVKAEILELARRRGVTVISVPYDTYNSVRRIHLSLPISYLMRHDVTSCDLEDLVDDVRPLFQRARAVPVLDDDGRVVGVITRADLVRPVRRRVALVDHNERGQSVRGIEQAEIVAVVDHHRIADVQTSIPPIMRVEPLGACSTLIAKLYAESGATMSPNVAGILLSGILTDTLLFRSPTTTDEDRRIAAQLAHRAGVDLVELGQAILAEASNLAGRRPEDLLGMDFKEFTFDGARFGVSVIETANADVLTPRHDDLYEALRRLRDQQSYASVLLAVIDITKEQTSILVDGHAETIAESFGGRLQDGRWIKLPGVYSRKKQIVPTLARARAQLPK